MSAMIIRVKSDNTGSSGSTQFTLPLKSDQTYDFTIDWGDGGSTEAITNVSSGFPNITHTFIGGAGQYDISITENVAGGFPAIFFDDVGDKLKLLQLKQWGTNKWVTFMNAFTGCSNLTITATDEATADTGAVTDFSTAWRNCASITSFPLINTSSGTNFYQPWAYCYGLTSFPLIDTSSATSLSGAWYSCSGLTSFPLIITSNCTNFTYTWGGCSHLTSFPLIDTSLGNNFTYSWSGCTGLTSFPVLDTSEGTDFTGTWQSCTGLTGSFTSVDTAKGTIFQSTWGGCSGLTSFPILDTSKGTNFAGAWNGCSGLTSFPLIDTHLGTNFSTTWYGCTGLTSFPLIDTSSGTNFFQTWYGCTHLTSFPLLVTSNVTNFEGAWSSCTGLTSFPLIDTSKGTSFYYTWSECSGLTSFPALDTSKGTNFVYTWRSCTGLTSFPTLDTSSGINFNATWQLCTGLTSFPTLVLSNGTNFSGAWYGCTGLTIFPLVDTSKGTDFRAAWINCTGLTSFPLIDTSKGVYLGDAWKGCTYLASFPLLDTSSGIDFESTWDGCLRLTSFPTLNTSLCTNFRYTWRGCLGLTSFPFIDTSSGTSFHGAWESCSNIRSFPALNLRKMSVGTNCFYDCTIPTFAYSAILIDMAANNVNTGVTFEGGNSKYFSTAVSARSTLTVTKTWIITDAGTKAGTPLIVRVKTDNAGSASDQFILPLKSDQTYDFEMDWGDGIAQTINSSTNLTHTYTAAGEYDVSVTENVLGGFPTIYFNNTGDKLKSLQLKQWGTNTWVTFHGSFYGCSNLTITATDEATANTGSVTDFISSWQDCSSLTSFSLINTSSGTDFSGAWSSCSGLTTFPATLDTSNGTDFSNTWNSCSSLTTFPALNTSKGTSFAGAWNGCSGLTSFPATLDTSLGVDFTNAWSNCTGLTAFPLINTSNGTSFYASWQDCMGLLSFPVLNLRKMSIGINCFANVKIPTSTYSAILIDLATNNVNTGVTFGGGTSKYNAASVASRSTLTTIKTWTITDGGQDTQSLIFRVKTDNTGSSGSDQFTLPLNSGQTYDFTVDWGDGYTELITNATTGFPTITHTYATAGTYDIYITENAVGGFPTIYFNNAFDRQKLLQLKQWGTNKWVTLNSSFYSCPNLTITATDEATADIGSVTDFSSAWRSCTGLTSFPIINTSSGTNFTSTWQGCSSFTDFPLIDTSSGTDFSSAWNGCAGLTNFPILVTSLVANFSQAWQGCSSLTDFPAIDTSSGTNFSSTWKNCSIFSTFPVLNFRIMDTGNSCFESATIPVSTYSDILTDIATYNVNTGVTFSGGNSKYKSTATADRAFLVDTQTWIITDGGLKKAPVTDFTADTSSGVSPLTVTFTDVSAEDPVLWVWDFGDSTSSTTQNPQHIYSTPGIYTIGLTATNDGGSDTNTKIDYITVINRFFVKEPDNKSPNNTFGMGGTFDETPAPMLQDQRIEGGFSGDVTQENLPRLIGIILEDEQSGSANGDKTDNSAGVNNGSRVFQSQSFIGMCEPYQP